MDMPSSNRDRPNFEYLKGNNVYQVIVHEYSSDDGHYNERPFGNVVISDKERAHRKRDELNSTSITEHNELIAKEVTVRRKLWTDNGGAKGEMPPVRDQKYSLVDHHWLSKFAIDEYEKVHTFTGDPTDIDAIERFAGRKNSIEYFTVEELLVIP